MNLQKLILTKNDAYTEANKIIPCGILWHSTGANNADLKRYVGPDDGKLGVNTNNNHWNKPGFRKCGHAMIGKLKDGSIATYQTLPWDYRCMLSGKPSAKDDVKPDPRGSANVLGYIQFEICEDSIGNSVANKEYAMAVYKEAVEFSAYICKTFNFDPLGKNRWGLPVTLDHASAYKLGLASNHGDVLHWFGKHGVTLAKIRQDIADAMGQQPTPEPEPEPGELPYKVRLERCTPYYEKPDRTSKVTGMIEITTNYTIVEESGVYGKLKSGAGWVQLKEEPAEPEPDPGKVPYKVHLEKGTPYYEKPDNKSKVTGKIEATTNYTIVEESGDYGKLKSGAGWVQLKGAPAVPEPFKVYVARVTTNVLNIRKSPTTQSDIVGTIKKGATYTIMEEQSGQGSTKGWGRLKSGAGWISLDYMQFVRYV